MSNHTKQTEEEWERQFKADVNAICKGYNQALRDCEKQITSAGYKVEE